ncbi:MAG: type II secretion system protein [Puniceicoccaceae bacterium]
MRNRYAFTLVELLTVIAVIAILAAITFGISAGVYERQSRTRAEAELSALASALEAYRAQHGSYPVADGTDWDGENAEILYQALTGQIDPKGDEPETKKVFIDISKFELKDETDKDEDTFSDDNAFLDPWGLPYGYQFDDPADGDPDDWNRFGYLLFSFGPDGEVTDPDRGIFDKEAEDNPDNIYVDD